VRSNHLSYRPIIAYPSRPKEPQAADSQLRQQQTQATPKGTTQKLAAFTEDEGT